MKKIIFAMSILLSLLVGDIFFVAQDVNAVSFDTPAVDTIVLEEPSIETTASENDEPSNETETSVDPSTASGVVVSELSLHDEQEQPSATEQVQRGIETKPTEPINPSEPVIMNNAVYDVYTTADNTSSVFDSDSVVFKDTNETVYAITSVNVRSGPGTGYAKLGMCYRGDSVTRIGIGNNGWSKISYNGSEAYICSDYLSDSKPESVWKDGMYGRLTIPSVGIDVGLYYCKSNSGSTAQSIVNAADSAAFIDQIHVTGAIIADHNNQGFEAMKNSKPNETYAYIDFGSYTQTYICTAIGLGHNYDNDLVDWNGVSLNYDYISGGLAMYTCNENWQNVTISYWQPI